MTHLTQISVTLIHCKPYNLPTRLVAIVLTLEKMQSREQLDAVCFSTAGRGYDCANSALFAVHCECCAMNEKQSHGFKISLYSWMHSSINLCRHSDVESLTGLEVLFAKQLPRRTRSPPLTWHTTGVPMQRFWIQKENWTEKPTRPKLANSHPQACRFHSLKLQCPSKQTGGYPNKCIYTSCLYHSKKKQIELRHSWNLLTERWHHSGACNRTPAMTGMLDVWQKHLSISLLPAIAVKQPARVGMSCAFQSAPTRIQKRYEVWFLSIPVYLSSPKYLHSKCPF